MNHRLDTARRRRELDALTASDEPVDVLVIGGGVTGTGVALDAASRGLRTVLVEARDWAFGTSRWSSKLVHGGLRYLVTGNVGVARESALERGVLMTTTAPQIRFSSASMKPTKVLMSSRCDNPACSFRIFSRACIAPSSALG